VRWMRVLSLLRVLPTCVSLRPGNRENAPRSPPKVLLIDAGEVS
jgi:hypothetical protein